eukprot:tig00001408_g8612.t1
MSGHADPGGTSYRSIRPPPERSRIHVGGGSSLFNADAKKLMQSSSTSSLAIDGAGPSTPSDRASNSASAEEPARVECRLAQSLVSIVLDPRAPPPPPVQFNPPNLASFPGSDITRFSFDRYLELLSQKQLWWSHTGQKKVGASDSSTKPDAQSAAEGVAECMRVVPDLYFRESLHLEEPFTFNAAFPMRESFSELDEKLQRWLDCVEVQLIKQVSARSDSFFSALENLQELHVEVGDVVKEISTLRRKMRQLDESAVVSSLKVFKLRRQRQHAANLYTKLKLIKTVRQTQPTIQLLLSTSDYAGALDLISSTQSVLRTQLAGIQAFRHLSHELAEKVVLIEKMMSAEFVQLAVDSIRRSQEPAGSAVKKSASNYALADGMKRSPSNYAVADPDGDANERMIPLLLGLTRSGRLGGALQALRERLGHEVKAAMKQAMVAACPRLAPGFGPGDEAGALERDPALGPDGSVAGEAGALGALLAELGHEAFMGCMAGTYASLLALLRRCAAIRDLVASLLQALAPDDPFAPPLPPSPASGPAPSPPPSAPSPRGPASATPPPPPRVSPLAPLRPVPSPLAGPSALAHGAPSPSPAWPPPAPRAFAPIGAPPSPAGQAAATREAQLAAEAAEAVQALCEAVHQRCARVLALRAAAHARLSYPDFLALYEATRAFVFASEEISRRKCVTLRGALLAQAKAFLQGMHAGRLATLQVLLENESWAQADVPSEFQELLDGVLRLAARPAASDADAPAPAPAPAPARHPDGPGAVQKRAKIGTASFAVVNTVLMLLQMVSDYLQCGASLPVLATDVLTKLAELVKVFNQRSCQLLLGAAAMQVAGLKSITAKHLALCSQCLSLLIALLPHMRAALQGSLQAKHHVLLSHLDQVVADYEEHRAQIFAKLVSIMRDRCDPCAKQILSQTYDGEAGAALGAPSEAMKALVKGVGDLHRVLSPILPADQILDVLERVFGLVSLRLAEHFAAAPVASSIGKKRVHEELAALLTAAERMGVREAGLAALDKVKASRFPQGLPPPR